MTVVASRKFTSYGKEVCEMLIKGLAGQPVVIVSGLALGIDSIAHRAAIDTGLKTVAIPGSSLDEASIYPSSHLTLARNILESGGALISPFPHGTCGMTWMFPFRNRIMAGISHATLVIEANIKSGTLITSKHATEFKRDVFTVPGSIFSQQSEGPHQLIRLGATPISSVANLREALGFPDDVVDDKSEAPMYLQDLSDIERLIINIIATPRTIDDIVQELDISATQANIAITTLEMKGVVSRVGSHFRRN